MSDRELIVVVEDEEHLAQGLLFNLKAEGYRTHHEADGDSAITYLLTPGRRVDAILLDVMLPGPDGFAVTTALREVGMLVPIILLTARGRTEDVLKGFEAGADDYVTKPFDLDVLLARLSSALRRSQWRRAILPVPNPDWSEDYVLGDTIISLVNLQVHTHGVITQLTVMEGELLRYFLERPHKTISRKEILENVWRVHEDTDTRPIDNFIVRLRRYIEPDPARPMYLVSVRGIGYRFEPLV